MSQDVITCPNCGIEVDQAWIRCPNCKAELKPSGETTSLRKWGCALLALVPLVLIILGAGGFWLWRGGFDAIQGFLSVDGGIPTDDSATSLLYTSHPIGDIDFTPSATETFLHSLTETPTGTPQPSQTGTSTTSPTTTQVPEGSWEACPGTYLSRLQIDDHAYVAFDPPLANRVRAEPNTSSEILGSIEPGVEVIIKDGPTCAGSWIWWKIRVVGSELRGWTSEGDQENYWLVPLP